MPPTVLLVSFGEIMRRGLRGTLDDVECRVLERPTTRAIDVVLFDMDQARCSIAALQLQARYPRALLIACSTQRPVMRVFRLGQSDRPLTVSELISAIMAVRASRSR